MLHDNLDLVFDWV